MLIVSVIMLLGSAAAFSNVHTLTKVQANSLELYAKKPTMSGVGGLPGFKSNSKKPVTSKAAPTTKSITKASAKQSSTTKPKKNGTSKSVFEQPKLSTDTPWSSILVAFLNPLRNPNSLFLYLLIIVSVLGKLNENK
jgi:hypothetical protein